MISVYLVLKKNHVEQLQNCLQECHINGINLNPKKCTFYVNFGVLLRHVVCHDKLLVDPRKVIVITSMPIPSNVTQIKWFLGVVGFYQRYFQDFASKVTPMCKLLKRDELFIWT
jgi:hypothetical protein